MIAMTTGWINFSKFSKSRVEGEMRGLFNLDEVKATKEKELKNWIDNGIFDREEYQDQNAISVTWMSLKPKSKMD